MDTLHPICAGLDVHKDTVVACVRWLDNRQRPQREVKTFGTTTPDLLELLDWLQAHQVPVVAVESTGVYWKPIFNLLESHREVFLVNPEHIKKVPGRKTDVKDCEWIGQLERRIGAEMEKDRPPEPPPGEGGGRSPAAGDSGPATAGAPPLPKGSAPAAPKVGLWAALGLLTTIAGISRRVAEVVLAEVGTEMGRFATHEHLASWAGLCPGNHESAGKRRSGRTGHGNAWLRAALVQAAWAATRTKGTYLSAQYRRLVRRCGKKALVGVAHSMLVMCCPILKKGEPYRELGADYLAGLAPERRTQPLVRQLESLGHKVTLEPKAVASAQGYFHSRIRAIRQLPCTQIGQRFLPTCGPDFKSGRSERG